MPGFPPHTPSVKPHGVTIPSLTGSDAVFGQEVSEMEMILDRSDSPFCFTSTPPEPDGEETHQEVMNWRQDGDLQESGPLEQRWVLWHEFMKKHAHLDTWLRLAEQAVSSPNPAHITYITAKEELRKFERLQREAGSLLIQLDDLTHRNRTLTRLFHGAMQARLLASARSCGQRWDEVNAKLESIIGCRKLFVSEWEGFEAEREELALWLADLDVRLTEVDHLTGNTCEKLRRLQSFQQCVCTNSARVNALLQRGEALIQRSEPSDAQHVENRLLELLRGCGLAYNNIARTHTRLLSMRLVFEDDWILSQATDSGCPSENLLGEEGAPLDKTNLDLPASSNPWKAHPEPDFSPLCVPPPSPSSLSSPAHEHLGLEWDPSVDIGRSVSPDEADSSYFSINTGLCHRDGLKRRSYISSLGSQSDIINDIINQEADSQLEEHCDHSVSSPTAFQGGWTHLNKDQWVMSTPVRNDREVLSFDGGRVREWLGVQSPVLPVRRTSCSKAVQTDVEAECYLDGSYMEATSDQHHHNHTQQPLPAHSPISSHDLSATTDRLKQRSNLKVEEEQSCCEGAERHFSEQSVTSSSTNPSSSLLSPTLLSLLLAAALVLLACLIWVVTEPPCHRSSRMPRSFHLALRYVNGPPPT